MTINDNIIFCPNTEETIINGYPVVRYVINIYSKLNIHRILRQINFNGARKQQEICISMIDEIYERSISDVFIDETEMLLFIKNNYRKKSFGIMRNEYINEKIKCQFFRNV